MTVTTREVKTPRGQEGNESTRRQERRHSILSLVLSIYLSIYMCIRSLYFAMALDSINH